MKTFNVDQIVGQVIDHCRVEQFLSRGPLGAIYHAQQKQRSVAITVFLLPPTVSDTAHQQFRTRFLREAPALISLRHPHLFPLYNYGEWEGWPYLITPYTTKGSLATLIQRQGPWFSASVLPVLEQIIVGLEYAHRHGQIHGMLTPANIVRAGNGSFQVAGLGLQRLLERRGILACQHPSELLLTLAGSPLCPPKYLAPEYQQGNAAHIRSDVYSLGVIMAELLCGRFLPETLTSREVLPWLKQQAEWQSLTSLQPIMQCVLAEDSEKRYPHVSDLLTAYMEQAGREIAPHKTQFRHPSPVTPPPTFSLQSNPIQPKPAPPQPSSTRATTPQWTFPTFPSPTLPLLEAENNIPRPRRRRGNRQRRKVIAALAGSLLLGAIGGASLTQMFKPATSAGNAIGQTTQALNSAQEFLDQRATEHRQRLLIHLPNGNFVAYSQGCTHSGVLVHYDPQTHMLVCPAHGAIFDPAQGGRVMRGPATTPLPVAGIHIDSAGTITLQ